MNDTVGGGGPGPVGASESFTVGNVNGTALDQANQNISTIFDQLLELIILAINELGILTIILVFFILHFLWKITKAIINAPIEISSFEDQIDEKITRRKNARKRVRRKKKKYNLHGGGAVILNEPVPWPKPKSKPKPEPKKEEEPKAEGYNPDAYKGYNY